MSKKVRVTTYIDPNEYRLFRSVLARRGETVKGWLAKQIKMLIKDTD